MHFWYEDQSRLRVCLKLFGEGSQFQAWDDGCITRGEIYMWGVSDPPDQVFWVIWKRYYIQKLRPEPPDSSTGVWVREREDDSKFFFRYDGFYLQRDREDRDIRLKLRFLHNRPFIPGTKNTGIRIYMFFGPKDPTNLVERDGLIRERGIKQ